jgi:hypothetical protein
MIRRVWEGGRRKGSRGARDRIQWKGEEQKEEEGLIDRRGEPGGLMQYPSTSHFPELHADPNSGGFI